MKQNRPAEKYGTDAKKSAPAERKFFRKMIDSFKPEGELYFTPENQAALSSVSALERAMQSGRAVEGLVTLCDSDLRLHVDLKCAHGILEPDEAVLCRAGESRKDIAIVSRVGKPVTVRITSMEKQGNRVIAHLSRRLAQSDCQKLYLSQLRPGDLVSARVTHLENFGAFLDIGCGMTSLLSVDSISVSRISHPRNRLSVGDLITVVVKSNDPESGRIYVTLRELLGTWQENADRFAVGQTVAGIIRSVEHYGAFIELAPNLAGLSEVRSEEHAAILKQMVGKSASVYIKSIIPERMKIKLVIIDAENCAPVPKKLSYFIDKSTTSHISRWVYSPPNASKQIETRFD